jgi:hypothetical protein
MHNMVLSRGHNILYWGGNGKGEGGRGGGKEEENGKMAEIVGFPLDNGMKNTKFNFFYISKY